MSRPITSPIFFFLTASAFFVGPLEAATENHLPLKRQALLAKSKRKRPRKVTQKTKPVAKESPGGIPRIHAASAIVIDAQSGKILHSVNPDQERAVASTQKLMTALLVAEGGGLDKTVRIEASDTWAEPSKLDIKAGEVYRRGDLLRILLVKSMNDVARALARDNAGSVEAFAKKMNTKASQLGMTSSHFVNPNGLPAEGQHSSARDMAKVAAAAYKMKAIREIICLKELQWQHPNGQVSEFHNTNRVLSSLKACNGMKTGYTQAAGFCLVSSASAGGRDVISVVLGDAKEFVWNDSHRLLEWGLGSDAQTARIP
ncbi:MAG: D-alanyl-D-alanine carboxypeptidase (penicillin-binding protein 5/6) [Verrucomicrobia bacterium]|nr:MAG: D-alanyl-D-alanine carboxypeptidase (penicillin-binding protein 5/6) [Verrucomicrobiota bacterium]